MKWCNYNLGWEKVLCHDLQEPYTQCIGLSDPAPMTAPVPFRMN